MLISNDYQTQLRALHSQQAMWGASAQRWLEETIAHGEFLQAKTVLDYGCGKGTLKAPLTKAGFEVLEYDPGIPGKDKVPGPVDMVACLDVLEHIEPGNLDSVLADIKRLSFRGAILVIALYPSGTKLPDGRDSHLIIQPIPWWIEKLEAVFGPVEWEHKARPTRNPNRVKDVIVVRVTS